MSLFATIRQGHINLMQKSIQLLGNVLQSVSQETATTLRDGPNGWTTAEVVCHLRDFDQIFRERVEMMLVQDHPDLPAYDHEAMAIEMVYNCQDVAKVYQQLVTSRAETVAVFQQLTDEQWERTGIHPSRGHFTLTDAAIQVGHHDINHAEQISRILNQP